MRKFNVLRSAPHSVSYVVEEASGEYRGRTLPLAMPNNKRITLRPMTTADLGAVRHIERNAYGTRVPSTPFEREIHNGLAHYIVAIECTELPPEHERVEPDPLGPLLRLLGLRAPRERIVGFAGVWYTVDQLHLVTLAVDPPMQRRGIAHRLLFEVYRLAIEAELRTIALEVRASNTRARALYEQFGFTRVGNLRAYYANNNEDATVMLTPELTSIAHIERIRHLRQDHAARYRDTIDYTAS